MMCYYLNVQFQGQRVKQHEKHVSANVPRRWLQIKGSHSFRFWNKVVRDAEETHFIKTTQQDHMDLVTYIPVLLNVLFT